MSAGAWANSVPVKADRSGSNRVQAETISAEALRYSVPRNAIPMIRNAWQLSDSGDYQGAIQQLQKTLAKYPTSGAYVYSLLGAEYLRLHQFQDAIDALGNAVKLLPRDAANHANLGFALVSSGEFDRAEPEFQRALELDPKHGMARQLLTALELNKGASK